MFMHTTVDGPDTVVWELKQNSLPFHRGQFTLENIARFYIRHRSIESMVATLKLDPIMRHPIDQSVKRDIIKANARANYHRTRAGSYRCKFAKGLAMVYVDDVTGSIGIAKPRTKGSKWEAVLSQEFAYQDYAIGRPITKEINGQLRKLIRPELEWCWSCQQFFTLADSQLMVGEGGRHYLPGLSNNGRKKICTYWTCPYCHACSREHTEQRIKAHEFAVYNFIKCDGNVIDEVKKPLAEVQELASQRREANFYAQELEAANISEAWKKRIMDGDFLGVMEEDWTWDGATDHDFDF